MVNCQLRPYTDLNVSLILAGFMPNEYCLSRYTKDSLYFAGGINSLLVRKYGLTRTDVLPYFLISKALHLLTFTIKKAQVNHLENALLRQNIPRIRTSGKDS